MGVLQMPSHRGVAWRGALKAASRAGGWALAKIEGETLEGVDDTRGVVLLLKDGAQALALAGELDGFVVISEPLAVICDALGALYPDKPAKAYAVAAERLAAAVTLQRLGGLIVEGAALSAAFPYIGTIERVESGEPPTHVLDPAPLAIYADGGPKPGRQTPWRWDVFSFKTTPRSVTPPPLIDLTGRSRVIFHGPRYSMPAGEWRIKLGFWLNPEERASLLKFEWGAREDFEVLELQLDEIGDYEVELTKRLERPGALELRAWVTSGHFLGEMRVSGASLLYVED